MFELRASEVVDLGAIPNPILASLHEAWLRWKGWRPYPSLSRFQPAEVPENVGRLHLVEVLADGSFRFLHYGAMVTNPDAMDMTGRTTAEYRDAAFRALVESNYAEAAARGTAMCRSIKAVSGDGPYEYVRIVLPFGERGVEFLVVGTQRVNVPAALDRRVLQLQEAGALRVQAERSRRLAAHVDDPATLRVLRAMSTACELRAAEIDRNRG